MSKDRTIPYRTANEIVDAMEDRRLANVVDEAIRKVNYHDDQILVGAERIARIAREVTGSVNQGRSMNELGEFQRAADEVDRHIALRHAAYQTLGMVLGSDASKLATGRMVRHLRDDHGQDLSLPEGDMMALNALHKVAQDQSGAKPTCQQFSTF